MAARRHRELTPDERRLWKAATRDVRPLPHVPTPPAPPPAPAAAQASVPAGPVRLSAPAPAPATRPGGIDRHTLDRLGRGAIRVEARLDLHGLTQAEAHASLDDFITREHRAGRRCVLVVTGRGPEPDGGVLRREVPRWLEAGRYRSLVLGATPARPRHGGGGALYVLLRRRRP